MPRSHVRHVARTLLLIAWAMAACGPSFDDETASLVRKPMVLSVVLDPPEAAPGESVTATVLMADARGPLSPVMQMWAMIPPEQSSYASFGVSGGEIQGSNDEESTDEGSSALPEGEIGFGPVFPFVVPDAARFTYDAEGLAPLQISFAAALDAIDPALLQSEDPAALLQELIGAGKARAALRTLIVSQRTERNRNPRVTSLSVSIGKTGERTDLSFLTSEDPDPAARRDSIRSQAFVYRFRKGERLYFHVTVEDDGENPDTSLQYQWISLGGNFEYMRKSDQPWIPPRYIGPDEHPKGVPDEALERPDVNLYPVWLVVRDSGVPGQLGQGFAEFYVKIIE